MAKPFRDGWLQAEWEVDEGVTSMNLGGWDPENPNAAPKITSGSPDQTVQVGKPLKLSVAATDDGLPKVRPPRPGGVRVRWIEYRGPADMIFDPEGTKPVYGKAVESTTEALFSTPGSYWIRAVVSDGQAETNHDIKVTWNALVR